MDTFLLILGIISMLTGIAGSFLPILPGPPLSYLSLILLHFTSFASFSTTFLVMYGVATMVIFIADLIMPAGAAKVFGASKFGSWGATLGVVAGIFLLPPLGLIIFPFVGALVGEILVGKRIQLAFKAAWGSFLGFILGIVIKLVLCLIMAFYFFRALFEGI
jgi:uncharacterized protein